MSRIAYLVHDTGDAAVERRVRMFRAGGAQVSVAGFHRRSPPATVAGVPVRDLGRTADGAMIARARAVLGHVLRPGEVRAHVADADVVVARNLEALALAVRGAQPGQRVVYECLDIHRLLSAPALAGRMVRGIERWLLQRVALVLTSSPAFEREHFRGRQRFAGRLRVEENKVLALDGNFPATTERNATGPCRIGWFGMLRCRRSLAMLRDLVRRSDGAIEVLVAGIPAYTEFDDFDRDVADVPGLTFVGRYTAADLASLYGAVDFAWAIDYFEEGQNSSWLLPNRLYESIAFGAVPIALATVETGRWLRAHGVGLVVDDPLRELASALPAMSGEQRVGLADAVAAVPRAAVVATAADCLALTEAVLGTPLA